MIMENQVVIDKLEQAFNSYVNDNTYVGYMYADPSNFVETNSGSASFTYIQDFLQLQSIILVKHIR